VSVLTGVMEVLRHPGPGDPRLARAVLTLGNFDGVHLGHQEILNRTITVARAQAARAGLLTFYPHPISVLAPDAAPPLITPMRSKLEVLAGIGIDLVWVVPFSRRFARLRPETFIYEFVMPRVDLAGMVVGYNVNFGQDRSGNAALLADIGMRAGFPVEIVGPVVQKNLRVSSTEVRRALLRGEVAAARRMLGRPHFLRGRVGHGAQRGREIGFPTANLSLSGGLVPLDGVYAVRVDGLGPSRSGVANIGTKPTFGGGERGLEVHIFDFDGDLYRRRLRVGFVERLRGELRFASAAALAQQIRRDVADARKILAAASASGEPEVKP
jgi:riboflavin kinase/FMN adenylyltransferase